MAQLEEVYGPNHAFTANCDVRTFNTPNDNKTAESISEALGTKTEVHQQKTYTGHRLSPWLGHVMVADQESARPLLTPGEVLTFNDNETIIFIRSKKPIRARKLRYFEDPQLMRRVLPSPALTAQRPYPYRVKPQPNPWLRLVVATAASSRRRAGGASEEQGQEIDREVATRPRAAAKEREIDVLDSFAPDEDFEQWHRQSVLAVERARSVADAGPDDVTRRAQFDHEQSEHRRETIEKRMRAQAHEMGR
jgi:type IV secretion system protein VirD4